ncbi:beta-glucuronosyltransferase GlcAT14B-like [Wolffia australiana]
MKGAAVGDRKWVLPLTVCSLVSVIFFLYTISGHSSSPLPFSITSSFRSTTWPVFIEDKLRAMAAAKTSKSQSLPRLAYLISGSLGDGVMLKRALLALYHPHNLYIVHLDLEATPRERLDLRDFVKNHPLFAAVGNVMMITKANLITYRGPTMVANTLHAAAILLKEGGEWDWFINLSASDYPLVTQDDLLHTMSSLPRDLNFIDHTSNIGWKEFQRAKPIIIDPGLYLSKKEDVFWITQRRSVPTAFKLFTGSAWMALSRAFVEYCVWGWENLPRAVLMYYANFISSPEGYFHTVICNSRDFRNTTVNSDLHFITWDNPPKQHPHYLTAADFDPMAASNAPFARKFPHHDPVLDRIDSELLVRLPGSPTPGGWCAANLNSSSADACLVVGNSTLLRPGPGAARLRLLFSFLLSPENFRPRQCQ